MNTLETLLNLVKPALGIHPIPPGKTCTECHGEEADAVVSYSRDVMVCKQCDSRLNAW